jgi:hypothetical protein
LGWDSNEARLVEIGSAVAVPLGPLSGLLGYPRPCRPNQLGKLPQVLGGGCKQELILSAARTAQTQTSHLQDPLKMNKQQLDPLAALARPLISRRAG